MGFTLMVKGDLGAWGTTERAGHVGPTKIKTRKTRNFVSFPCVSLELTLLSIILSLREALARQGTRVDRSRGRHGTLRVLYTHARSSDSQWLSWNRD